jgi:DNA-binding CsgD family transcriptional regulator
VAASEQQTIVAKLDVLIRLVALQIASDRSITEGAHALHLAGLDNKTIAKVLNTTQGTVRALISARRIRSTR